MVLIKIWWWYYYLLCIRRAVDFCAAENVDNIILSITVCVRRLNPHDILLLWRRWVRRSIPVGYLTIATLPTTTLTTDNRGVRSTCSRRRAPSIVSACASATRCIKVYRPRRRRRRRRQGYPMPPQTRHRCVVLFIVLQRHHTSWIFRWLFWFCKNLYIVIIIRTIMI